MRQKKDSVIIDTNLWISYLLTGNKSLDQNTFLFHSQLPLQIRINSKATSPFSRYRSDSARFLPDKPAKNLFNVCK